MLNHTGIIDTVGGTNPVPYLSKPSVEFVLSELLKHDYDMIVEYGSGSSTRFFLKNLAPDLNPIGTFVSVEYHLPWFLLVSAVLQEEWSQDIEAHTLNISPWNPLKVLKYLLNDGSKSKLEIPSILRRVRNSKKGLIRSFVKGRKDIHSDIWLSDSSLPGIQPHDGTFSAKFNNQSEFYLELRAEFMKDQYGESSVKDDYIMAGLNHVEKLLSEKQEPSQVAFMIDGGPRMDIVDKILDLEESNPTFQPTIFLFDAAHAFYEPTLARRSSGIFYRGTPEMLNDEILYVEPEVSSNPSEYEKAHTQFWYGCDQVTLDMILEKELWLYAKQ